jgi:diaminopimelate decarboxylase
MGPTGTGRSKTLTETDEELHPLRRILPDSSDNQDGVLHIGGCSLPELAAVYGTPLYVYDEETLRAQARRVSAAFASSSARVSFAAKACATVAVLRVFREEGLGLDTVSAGEIEAGLRAGFAPAHMHLHGNAKSDEDLARALELDLGAIVVDNLDELRRLESMSLGRSTRARVILRLALSVGAKTHAYLLTSGADTKFGLGHDELQTALSRLGKSSTLRLIGLHAHPGSQISDARVYTAALASLLETVELVKTHGLGVEEAGIGGGWAVPYVPNDPALAPEDLAASLRGLLPNRIRLAVEPGRALVARAGVAVYRVVSVKQRPAGRLVAVDGGMGDNPRPVFYGAGYSAIPVNDPAAAAKGSDRLVGRYCEEGDVLAEGVHLPVVPGDLIAVPTAGAYQLSMASAYNLVPQPAVVLVSRGRARLVTRRASHGELLSRELDGL